jgi:hypothetical protein
VLDCSVTFEDAEVGFAAALQIAFQGDGIRGAGRERQRRERDQ